MAGTRNHSNFSSRAAAKSPIGSQIANVVVGVVVGALFSGANSLFAAQLIVSSSARFKSMRRKMKFLALQCFSCNAMQVKQAKESSNRWSCSICNENQSLRKVFFSSDAAKDVRNFVQQANMVRGIAEEASAAECLPSDARKNFSPCHKAELDVRIQPQQPNRSKWERFLPESEISASDEENDPTDSKYVTSSPDPKQKNSQPRKVRSSKGASSMNFAKSLGNNVEPAERAYEIPQFGVDDKKDFREDAETAEPTCEDLGYGFGGVMDDELKHRSRKFSHRDSSSRPSSRLCVADSEAGEGLKKRGYAALSGNSSCEGSKVSQRERLQCQPSKWSRYLGVEDD
ncbi:hypothetical protein R1flu_002251 [Riccia fluitans]|uniref:MRN complex-interacting protein N-terminal domain-containing protein n=1 Tax=Riccia fluitans TaxID=41844 RepID=A0ABD1Y5N5_9MARC